VTRLPPRSPPKVYSQRADAENAKGFCCKCSWTDLVGCLGDPKTAGSSAGDIFEDVIILLCVRWYLYSLTYRDLEEIMAERGLSVDHVAIWRWVQR